jgi:hypothetical protein
MGPAQWGTIPEWVAGVGTAGAFVSVVIIYQRDRKMGRYENLRAQARLIDAWISSAKWQRGGTHGDTILPTIDLTISFSNSSPHAVRSVEIEICRDETSEIFQCGVVPPTGPGNPESRTCPVPAPPGSEPGTPGSEFLAGLYTLLVSFVDAGGNRWSRDSQGNLRNTQKTGI